MMRSYGESLAGPGHRARLSHCHEAGRGGPVTVPDEEPVGPLRACGTESGPALVTGTSARAH